MIGIRPEGYIPTEATAQPENLVITATYDFSKVEQNLRTVPLLGNKEFHPYHLSTITPEEISLDQLQPCSLYVLKPQLEQTKQLREAFLKQGIDLLNLKTEKALIYFNWGNKTNCALSPPVVEMSEDDHDILVIVDGLHRVVVAKESGLTNMVVTLIRNTACPLPVLPVGWDEIKLCDAVPSTERKRRFRFATLFENLLWISKNLERFNQGFDSSKKN